jgi:hypothetical protein
MGYTDTMLDQARAKLDAGQTAEAWALTAAIAKAEPENVRAWALMADIIAPAAPERASTYREKARAAEAARNSSAPSPLTPPMMSYQPSPAKLQLGEDIVQAEDNLLSQQNKLRALERQVASERTRRNGEQIWIASCFFAVLIARELWPIGMLGAASSGLRLIFGYFSIKAIEKDIGSAEAAITDSQQQLHRLRMQFSMTL